MAEYEQNTLKPCRTWIFKSEMLKFTHDLHTLRLTWKLNTKQI